MHLIAIVALVFSFNAFSKEYLIKFNSKLSKSTTSYINELGIVSEIPVGFAHFKKLTTKKDLTYNQIQSIEALIDVEYMEENKTYRIQEVFERGPLIQGEIVGDLYSKQWGLKNTGENSGGMWLPGVAGEDIAAESAWRITTGSRDVVIAVIDTGVDYTHKDLKDNMWTNTLELNGEEGVDDDGNGFIDDIYGYNFYNNSGNPKDGNGHGTHCAGIIGAAHDGDGTKGVMANVQIMALKFLADSGAGTLEGAISAIDYAIKMKADVMSNSWSGGGFSQALEDAIIAANEAGILFVVASGNKQNDNDKWPTYPANHEVDNVLSVGAMEGSGNRSVFSNYGKWTVHAYAPGSDIMSTVPGNGYRSFSGTSMATPFVSGIAGLILSQDRSMNVKELKEHIIKNSVITRDLAHLAVGGRANAYRVLNND